MEEGWWSGCSAGGKSGLFPSNFVKEVETGEDGEMNDLTDETGESPQGHREVTSGSQRGGGGTGEGRILSPPPSEILSLHLQDKAKDTLVPGVQRYTPALSRIMFFLVVCLTTCSSGSTYWHLFKFKYFIVRCTEQHRIRLGTEILLGEDKAKQPGIP